MASGSRGGRSVIVWRHFHAKALMFMAVLVQLLGSGRASYRMPPQSAPNGLYVGFVDENGEKQLKYVGARNTTSARPQDDYEGCPSLVASKHIDGPAAGSKLKHPADFVSCAQNIVMPSEQDSQDATCGLATMFEHGHEFTDIVVYKKDSAYAYGCDYGYGQDVSDINIWLDAEYINMQCGGWGYGGYYYDEPNHGSSGRCPSSYAYSAICSGEYA